MGLHLEVVKGAVLLAALALVPDAAPGAGDGVSPPVQVAPGKVVRWVSDRPACCRMDGEIWDPVEGSCWYPIDLLSPEGPLTLGLLKDGSWETATVRVTGYPYPEQRVELKDDTQVHLSPANLARAEREAAEVVALFGTRGPAAFSLPLGLPLRAAPPPKNFGARRVFNGEPRNPHNGADYTAAAGIPVLAVAPGRVVLAGEHFFAGRSVFVDHGDGLVSMYFHLSSFAVRAGQEVGRGDLIGAVGATGRASGPHLHFGLRWHGARIDPAELTGSLGVVTIRTAR